MHEIGCTYYVRLKWRIRSNQDSTFEKACLHQIVWEVHPFCASYSWKNWDISSTTGYENKFLVDKVMEAKCLYKSTHTFMALHMFPRLFGTSSGFCEFGGMLTERWKNWDLNICPPRKKQGYNSCFSILGFFFFYFMSPTASQNGAARQRRIICHSIKNISLYKLFF